METADRTADRRITRLHEVATELQAASDEETVYDAVIETAVEILGFDWCTVAVTVDGYFELKRVSSLAPFEEGERTFRVDEGIAGETLRCGESIVLDDESEHSRAKPIDDSIRSVLSVPLGDRGVFQGSAAEVSAFDDGDREVGELLAAHTTAALDRLDRERALKRKNEQLEEFAGVVSHDLRNPLNVAALRLELAMDDCDSPHLDDVADALGRMETLTEKLLTLAHAGTRVDEKEAIDLATLVETCWRTVETDDATLVVETDAVVWADRNRLRQLLENLVHNAVDHGSGDVTVRVGRLNDGGFYVEDDGPGIPGDERETVFESGYSTDDDGTGFGLAIVVDVVDAHDWDVAVTDSTDGGARFEITGVEFVE